MAGKGPKSYPDLRYLFMRGLIQHEKCQRSRHYLKPAAECTSRAIVSLELSDEPVKNVKQARKLEGIGGETCIKLTKLDEERNYSCIKPLGGRFVSSAGGILVALLNFTEEILQNGHSQEKPVLVQEEKVKNEAHHLTEETFHSGQAEAFCPAWWRLEVLIKRGYIKRRSVKKSPVLQLLPQGKQVAQRLRERNGLLPPSVSTSGPSFPSFVTDGTFKDQEMEEFATQSDGREESCSTADTVAKTTEKSLYTNDTGADGLILLVDTQEMGGERVGLGEVCQLLGQRGVVYRTRKLKTGDYSWLWRCQGSEIILPCLVERKRADDLARTLKEGRFWSQVNKMVEWKGQFEGHGDCKLYYILERRPEEYVVKCTDGCQAIGQCGDPTLQQLKLVIADLKQHPKLLVRETASLEMTTVILASLTSELKDGIKEGQFDWLLQEILTEKSTGTQQTPNHHNDQQNTNNPAKQTTVIKGVDTSSRNKADSGNWYEKIKPETLTYEEQLELVLEMSKKEVTVGSGGCDEVCHSQLPRHQTGKDSHSEEAYLSNVNVRYPKDYGFAKQNSKIDDVGKRNFQCLRNVCDSVVKFADADDSEDMLSQPLMQYHCSPGGSVIYPHKAGYRTTMEQSGYRPKMNRGRAVRVETSTESCSAVQGGLHSDHCDSYNSGVDRSPTHALCSRKAEKKPMTLQRSRSGADSRSPSLLYNDISQSSHTKNKSATVTKPMVEGIWSTHSDTPTTEILYKDLHEKENLSVKYENSPRKRGKSQTTNCETDLLTLHTESSCVDLDSIPAKNVKSKPKKIKLHFTPSPLNTEINITRTISSDKKSSVRKRLKNARSDVNGFKIDDRLDVKPRTTFINNTSLLYENEKQTSCDHFDEKSVGVLIKRENGKCDIDGKLETEDDCASYRSDEDLFAEAETNTDENVDENPNKDLSKTSLDVSFSSSGSDQSLPELADIMEKTGHRSEQCFDKDSEHNKIIKTKQSKKDEKVSTVMAVLPHVSEAAARSTLRTCGGDVEMCVSVLLESSLDPMAEGVVDLTSSQNN